MRIRAFVCNPFGENAYVVHDGSGNALVVDPGFYNESEFAAADSFIRANGLKLGGILNTHLHLDHCIGNGLALKNWHLGAWASEKDLFLIRNADRQAEMFGLELDETLPEPEKFLKDGDEVSVGTMRFLVLEVPGHSPGSLAFYEPSERIVFSGDALFKGSRGRTDLPGGDEDALLDSIRTKLLPLPAESVVLCGHGPSTTIGEESALQSFLH